MVKKITKYLKIAVCCMLIMSLVAPSYAALSASDGSAFVTKAEFDAALADFNSRLTTFEAGINSKIDSQVTSYLDRNGIWNGKEQLIGGMELINKNAAIIDCNLSAVENVVSAGTSTEYSRRLGRMMFDYPCIFTCTKTGLLMIDLKSKSNGWSFCGYDVGHTVDVVDTYHFGSSRVCFIINKAVSTAGVWSWSEPVWGLTGTPNAVVELDPIHLKLHTGKSNTSITSMTWIGDLMLNPWTNVALFFVNKGDNIGCFWYWDVFNRTTSHPFPALGSYDRANSTGKFYMEIDSAKIY